MSNSSRRNMKALDTVQSIQKEEIVSYVIYVRKSTEDEKHQVKSIGQQLDVCFEYAENQNVPLTLRPAHLPYDERTIKDIRKAFDGDPVRANEIISLYKKYAVIAENKSAKMPHNRPIWTGIINMIKAGQIRGLLGYAPDRFSRNLEEGGALLNLASNNLVRLKLGHGNLRGKEKPFKLYYEYEKQVYKSFPNFGEEIPRNSEAVFF